MTGKYLYEELQDKNLDPLKLTLELSYSLAYDARLERLCGSEDVTFKDVKISEN